MRPPAELRVARAAAGQLRALARDLRRVLVEARLHKASPPTEGLVLEVGGGQAPYARADVVVDKYPIDDFERPGETAMSTSKPLVVADGHHLPFADGAFAYAIAQHVLEHATDPVRFAGELSRVAGAGFVQVPSRQSELIYGWPFHPWLIDLDERGLVFAPRGDARAPTGSFMHEEFLASPLVRLGWAARRSSWHHSVKWRGQVPVVVTGESVAERTASFDTEQVAAALRSIAVPPLPPAVVAALRCPSCRSSLRSAPEWLNCTGCGCRYPVAGNVPLLLEESADRS